MLKVLVAIIIQPILAVLGFGLITTIAILKTVRDILVGLRHLPNDMANRSFIRELEEQHGVDHPITLDWKAKVANNKAARSKPKK
ncbi:MAG: hypothetical protein ACJAS1_006329 [Oleiphilaceae bacterium]|jgi:hypothetical protein